MLFVNAKINIGLQIVSKRADGYHNLQTVFYPVGLYAGCADNPVSFCDMIELTPLTNREKGDCNYGRLPEIRLSGRRVECPLSDNLVFKAAALFCEETDADFSDTVLTLEKHLPDGAGLGGGSADAAFTLRLLRDRYMQKSDATGPGDEELCRMALRLGADCPFFIKNKPSYAEGVGELLEPVSLALHGYWLVIVKPNIYVSTREAFSGVTPRKGDFDLRLLPQLPVGEWREVIKNDFEDSIFPQYPKIGEIKENLYSGGALYSSMTGSGSSVYAIFSTEKEASHALAQFRDDATIEGCYLLKM